LGKMKSREHLGLEIADWGLGQGMEEGKSAGWMATGGSLLHEDAFPRRQGYGGRVEGQAARAIAGSVFAKPTTRLAAVRSSKHAILRNEPELPTRNYERMLQGGSRLGCASGFFNSGSFGMRWADERDRYRERQRFAVKRRTARGGFDMSRNSAGSRRMTGLRMNI
jgi:hypothetical protein